LHIEASLVRGMARHGHMGLLRLPAGWRRNRPSATRWRQTGGEGARAVIRVAMRRTYQVRDGEGRLKANHQRIDNSDGTKDVWWEMPDGTKGLNGTPLADLPLYGSERVRNWNTDEPIVVVEGEKAAQALLDAGFNALGTVTGASLTPAPGVLEVLRGFDVILWADNDDPGRSHMERVAKEADGVANTVAVFTWHGAPEKGDAADHPAVQSQDPELVDRLLQDLMEAPRWQGVTLSQAPNSDVTLVTPIRFSEMAPPGPREYLVEGLVPKDHATTLFGDGHQRSLSSPSVLGRP
jgi:hypothetical protein